MNKYTATFADGTTITRGTKRVYGVAWRATWTDSRGCRLCPTGFAISADKVRAYKPQPHYVTQRMSPAAKADVRRMNDEYCVQAGYAVEIVPAVLIG